MIYGIGGSSLPPIGRTTDDLKFSSLEGLGIGAVHGIFQNLGSRSLRNFERRDLDPNITKDAKKQAFRDITPTSEFEESILTSARISIVNKDVGRTFTSEEANEYNKDIKKTYKAPQSQAGLDWDRRNHEAQVKRNNEVARIQNGFLPKSLFFVGGIGAAMVDPPNLALMLIPSVPQVRLALAAGRTRKSLVVAKQTGALLKKGKIAVPKGPTLIGGSKKADFASGALEGVAFGALTEIPNYVLAGNLQEEYQMQTLVYSMLGAGLFNGIIQVPLGAWGRASRNAARRTEFLELESSLVFKTANARQLEQLLPGVDDTSKQLRKLALLEIQDRATVRAAVAAKLQDPSLAPIAPQAAATGATFNSRIPTDFIPPGERIRAFFLRDAQRGLDNDLYFMTRSKDRAFREGFDEFIIKTRREAGAVRKAEKVKETRASTATKRLAQKAKDRLRKGEVDLEEESLEGFIDGGINLRGVEPDELDFSPNANATREVEVTMDSALASSKALDEVGVKAGYPEVRNLDRSKHLMKSLEMRLAAAKVALGDALNGRPVNVNFLVREAVALDMHNRGLITQAEYKDMLTNLAKEHKAYVEAPHSGILSSGRIEVVPDAEVKARALDEQAKLSKSAEELEGVTAKIDEEADTLDFDIKGDENYARMKKEFDEASIQEKMFAGEDTQEAMQALARCMAGGRK